MSLVVRNLSVCFETPNGFSWAVRQASLEIRRGERVALAGESGCGKTVLALALLGLLPRNALVEGEARLEEFDLLNPRVAAALRGGRIAMCWSNAERFFNPVLTVGYQICEAFLLHHPGRKQEAWNMTLRLLAEMGFDNPERIAAAYPSQLSGGMNQRAMLAMSLINQPELLIVDEPTRGLDDESRCGVVACLEKADATSMLIITHDLELARELAARACIMLNGRIVESGVCPELFENPQHPYTRLLVRAAMMPAGAAGPEAHG